MTPLQLLELVNQKAIPPHEFMRELSRTATGLIRQGAIFDAKTRIYRAQKIDSLPINVERMSYPPLNKAKLGRANLEGEQIFYSSAGLPTTFSESRLNIGDHLYVGEWESTAKMTLQPIGIKLDKIALNKEDLVEHLIHEVFTNKGEDMYEYSAIVSSHLLSGDCIDGLLYPSIIAQNQSHNIALKKKYVDKFLKLISVFDYKIIAIHPNLQYEVQKINFATPLKNGNLDWRNRPHQWVIAENYGELSFSWNGWDYVAKNPFGQQVDPI